MYKLIVLREVLKMNITFNGDPITLVGEKIKVGDNAPDFLVVDNNLKNVK